MISGVSTNSAVLTGDSLRLSGRHSLTQETVDTRRIPLVYMHLRAGSESSSQSADGQRVPVASQCMRAGAARLPQRGEERSAAISGGLPHAYAARLTPHLSFAMAVPLRQINQLFRAARRRQVVHVWRSRALTRNATTGQYNVLVEVLETSPSHTCGVTDKP